MTAIAQRSFSGGEIAPSLYARTDLARYLTSLRTCRNFIVQPHGGVTNRPGTRYIAALKDATKTVVLQEFVLDATDIADTYCLEIGDKYIRFFQNSGRVVVSGVAAWINGTSYKVGDLALQGGVTYYCTTAHVAATGTNKPGVDAGALSKWYALTGTIYEIPTPYAEADLLSLRFVQAGDVITIVHPSYAPRELTRTAHTKWALTAIAFGPSIAKPTNVAAAGGGAGTTRYWAVTAIRETTLEESLPGLYSSAAKVPSAGAPTVLSWDSVPGAISYNVYRSNDGQTYGLINSAGGNPVDSSDVGWTDADEIASSNVGSVWAAAPGQARNPIGAISATVRAYDGKYTITGNLQLVADAALGLDDATENRFKVYYSRDGEPRVLAGTSDEFTVFGPTSGATFPVSLTIDVPDNGYAALQIDVIPEVLPPFDGFTCSCEFIAGAVTWKGGASGFSDAGDTPDYSIAPPSQPTLFDVAGHYPSAVMYYQQRLLFGGTPAEPEAVWASKTGSFKNFSISTPLQADDAVKFTLVGRAVNAVKHLLDLGKLVVFGTAREVAVNDDENALRPDNVNPKKISANGTNELAPLEIDQTALFIQGRGTKVRDLTPIRLEGYEGTDLTVMAAHLFKSTTIVDWAFAQTPHSIAWVVRSDGVLLGLTYLREHNIFAWHRHDTDGFVERVCVVPEGSEDAVYAVVRRTINGTTVRYVERFASRVVTDIADGVFVDCSLAYDGRHTGTTTMTLSGGVRWDHEEQLTITASAAAFIAGNVGAAVFLTDAAGALVRVTLEAYTSATVMKGRADRAVPASMQGHAIGAGSGNWALALKVVTGLAHLEGKSVSVLGDGFVVASPNNADYAAVVVAAGSVTLDRPYARIQIGLPFISDLETLDIDASGSATIKDRLVLISAIGLYVETSRGIWVGRRGAPTAADPLAGMQEYKARSSEAYDDPTSLITDSISITNEGNWSNNGGILVRQVDPLPLTILSVSPTGYLPS